MPLGEEAFIVDETVWMSLRPGLPLPKELVVQPGKSFRRDDPDAAFHPPSATFPVPLDLRVTSLPRTLSRLLVITKRWRLILPVGQLLLRLQLVSRS